jgi:hypothetical protein
VRQVRQGQARAPDDPARVSADREVDKLVERGMAALPATYASALRAYLRHEMSPAEIARTLGITANAAGAQCWATGARAGSEVHGSSRARSRGPRRRARGAGPAGSGSISFCAGHDHLAFTVQRVC